jgi:hypothetical protein
LTGRIEELKITANKKYADKNETGKNIKYLDSQIKHITEVYIKKMDKGDNWLLASKPFGGYKCASCESYLGDLSDKTQHLPWNKIPVRDPSERLYRVGNGFSRMLQMLNIDNVNKHSDHEDMGVTSYNNNHKKDNNLPRVTEKQFHQSLYNIHNESINISADNIKMDGDIGNVNNLNQPKVYYYFNINSVKIYKKMKENKNEKGSEVKFENFNKTQVDSKNNIPQIKSLK